MNELSTVVSKGHILYCEKLERSSSDKMNPLTFLDKILEEFLPHLLKLHEGRPSLEYDNFSQALDEFFAHIGSQKHVFFDWGSKPVAQMWSQAHIHRILWHPWLVVPRRKSGQFCIIFVV